MSEQILKALMQLFAVVAKPNSTFEAREEVVKHFLLQQISVDDIGQYLNLFKTYYERYQTKKKKKKAKALALSSTKILSICSTINNALNVSQKIVIILRLFEFVKQGSEGEISSEEIEFVYAASDTFLIPYEEYKSLKNFVLGTKEEMLDSGTVCSISSELQYEQALRTPHIEVPKLEGVLWVLFVERVNMYLLRTFDTSDLFINGAAIIPEKVYVIMPGTSIKNNNISPIYCNDIIRLFNPNVGKTNISFRAENLSYRFKNTSNGVKPLNISAKSGELAGIMGSSGSGKSTLLSLLNGIYRPSTGSVTINDLDLHENEKKLRGLIGFVSQDDALMEDLTVFQNLYYNAHLSFRNYTKIKLTKLTISVLKDVGLYHIKDLQVGSSLNKKISGGERKRLSMALSLIREPSILLLDEPTSGLSSRDSEKIMDLLKIQTLKGKLVFVVIHQPSSDIFKMFNKILIMDNGGYLVYSGDPVDSVNYFRQHIDSNQKDETGCSSCGKINPEQIFNILEENILDEYGKSTNIRRKEAKDWAFEYQIYESEQGKEEEKEPFSQEELLEATEKGPRFFNQFKVFFIRDFLSKLSNIQYLVVALMETPLLAFFLSYLIRYYNVGDNYDNEYTFLENENLPIYLFMSVIIAVFMGLSISVQEIIKDRRVLKRERFLNLSKSAYLLAKISILFILGAIQSATFVLLGNYIMGIEGMFFPYWLMLFSTWAVSILIGLNVSSSFKNTVTVYILIPFLVIPNIILGGAFLHFEKINPTIASPGKIPLYGEIIPARWAYEALAVYQYKNNAYEAPFYKYNKAISNANYKKDVWLVQLKNKLHEIELNINNKELVKNNIELIRNELEKENKLFRNTKVLYFKDINRVDVEEMDLEVSDLLRKHLYKLRNYYIAVAKEIGDELDKAMQEKQKTEKDKVAFVNLKRNNYNESLSNFVRNKQSSNLVIEYENELYQKVDPVYQNPNHSFIKAHFYAPYKRLFNLLVPTYWMNLIVTWLFIAFFYLALYFDLLKRFVKRIDYYYTKITDRRYER